MPFDTTNLIKYPTDPGVYLMKDLGGKVLYVGKAINLKIRLKQYFTGADERPLIPHLIKEIEKIDTISVTNEKEALLLENTLIKKHRPKYNILLKDDKTYISLILTKHKWPLLKLIRYKTPPKQGMLFGPYTNAKTARQILDLIFHLFPIRQCSDHELASRTRPCILYDIKKCIAPCMNLCEKAKYEEHVKGIQKLLKGQNKDLIADLKRKMKEASDNLEFEKANDYLKKIDQIKHITEIQYVETPSAKDLHVVGLYRNLTEVVITCLTYKQGKLIGSTHYTFSNVLEDNADVIESFLVQHYQKDIPKEILICVPLENPKLIQEILLEKAHGKIKLSYPLKGMKKKLIELASKNAKALFEREKDLKQLDEKKLLILQEILFLNRFPRKIECFDTSNMSLKEPVAALVTFINGKKDTSKMRLFSIKGKSDDYNALKEAIYRHYKKLKEKNDLPDLLIIDGGKGQLNLAIDIMEKLNIACIDIISVTKQDSRHDKGLTEERVFVPHRKEPIIIHPTSPLLFLLQNIRDEAHRVAIGFHRKKTINKQTKSSLDLIEGIGPIKKRRLLTHFKSVKNIKKASIEELKNIKGLTKKDIDKIIKFQKS